MSTPPKPESVSAVEALLAPKVFGVDLPKKPGYWESFDGELFGIRIQIWHENALVWAWSVGGVGGDYSRTMAKACHDVERQLLAIRDAIAGAQKESA